MAVTSPRKDANQFDVPPIDWGVSIEGLVNDQGRINGSELISVVSSLREHLRKTGEGFAQVFDGKLNATGSVTLTASSTTTTLGDKRIGANSCIFFMPTTATAAAAMTALYVSARGKQTATLTHDSTADSDRTFCYAVIG